MAAVIEEKLSSSVGARGIFKKMMILSLVAVGHILDRNMLSQTGLIRNAVIFFYLNNEGISILENAVRIGLPVPIKLKRVLEQLSNKDDDV